MEHLTKYIIGGIVSFGVALLLRYLEAKSKLVYWSPHFALFEVPVPRKENEENVVKVPIQTDSINIQNLGSKSAEGIEIIFKSKPDHFMLTPKMAYSSATQENGSFVVKLENLGPKEYVILQLLSYATLPAIDNIRSTEGPAKLIPFQMQQAYPKWFQMLVAFFVLAGVGATFYWLAKLIHFLAKSIGLV
mgnify:CR=1 FL=1